MDESTQQPLIESPTSSDATGATGSTGFMAWIRAHPILTGLFVGLVISVIVIGILAALKIGVFSESSTSSSTSSNMMNNTTTFYPRPTLPNVQTTFRSS